MELTDLVGILSRLIHISSAVTLLGGLLFARQVLVAAGQTELIARYAGAMQAAIAGLLLSGLYNLLTKAGLPKGYHAVFGVKFLLALHVFAVAFLLPKADAAKRARSLTGILVSGGLILVLSAYLRYLTLHP